MPGAGGAGKVDHGFGFLNTVFLYSMREVLSMLGEGDEQRVPLWGWASDFFRKHGSTAMQSYLYRLAEGIHLLLALCYLLFQSHQKLDAKERV